MKQITLLVLLAFAINIAKAQYISEIIEYTPAPGQFINISPGLPWNAESIKGSPEKNGRMVSLGFWGGYIIVGFDEAIKNNPDNPYGVDFTIFGNAFQGSSEPGIVQVMKDENANGLPDDTWYELMGSDHHLSTTKFNHSITYTNPHGKYDIPWVDKDGNEGIVRYMKEFHTQEYYPSADSFPHINQENYTLYGTLLNHKSTQSVTDGLWVNLDFDYGYVDNKSIINNSHIEDWFLTPDNPYTLDVQEGCGGDAFDIHWAIDANGNNVDLDKIHWVRIYNGVAQNAGWLGENSTEISGIAVVTANASIQGQTHTIVSNQPPHGGGFPVASNLTWYTGDDFQFESHVVNMGRKQYPDMLANYKITWESNDESVATISESGLLSPKTEGAVKITAKWEDPNDPLAVVELDSVIVDSIVGHTNTTYIWERFYTGIYRQFEINIEPGGVDAITANNIYGDIKGLPGDTFTFDLDGLFTDPNDLAAEFIYLIFGGHDMSIADAEIANGKVTFDLKTPGEIGIIIKCQANGKMGQTTIPISVIDPATPTVANPIGDVLTYLGDNDTEIDLSNVFTSSEYNDADIAIALDAILNTDIAEISLVNKKITITPKQLGSTRVSISGTINRLQTQHSFYVFVNNSNGPELINKIDDIEVSLGEVDTIIDLSGMFTIEEGFEINIDIESNFDVNVAQALLNGTDLILKYLGVGETKIILKATGGGISTLSSFNIKVNSNTSTSVETQYISAKGYIVYPNPANNVVSIKNADKVNIEIFNLLGVKVGELGNYYSNQSIYIGHLKSGIYLMTIKTDSGIKSLKFQKQ